LANWPEACFDNQKSFTGSAMSEQGMAAFLFGVVIGWVTYYTLAHSRSHGPQDIAAVIGAVGGAAVLALFPAQSSLFSGYSIGLAVGFFVYWAIMFSVPFLAFGWKEGWRKVWERWASQAMIMLARDDVGEAGPSPRSRGGHGNG
jgi:hypothetical protein